MQAFSGLFLLLKKFKNFLKKILTGQFETLFSVVKLPKNYNNATIVIYCQTISSILANFITFLISTFLVQNETNGVLCV